MTHTNNPTEEQAERELEGLAMSIVFHIGDALYDALPKDIAHEHFVDARQATNDMAIDYAKALISKELEKREREAIRKTVATAYIDQDEIYFKFPGGFAEQTAYLAQLKETQQ